MALLAPAAFAKDSSAGQESTSPIQFFSGDVPRYTGFAAGAFGTNQYGLGDWGGYAKATLGAGLDVEYTIPVTLPKHMDLGASVHVEWAHVFPRAGSTLRRDDDILMHAGAWLRIPFAAWRQPFAFQPELGYGLVLHNADGHNGSTAHGWYKDQVISFALAVRWMPPILNRTIEVDIAPLYTIATEKGHGLTQLGFRLGVVWHVQNSFGTHSAKKAQTTQGQEA